MSEEYQKNKAAIARNMQKKIDYIIGFCNTFNEESEAFLYPMYKIISSAMNKISDGIGGFYEEGQKRVGTDIINLILNSFQSELDEITNMLAQAGIKKEKSHNELLTEKLLKEAGLQ